MYAGVKMALCCVRQSPCIVEIVTLYVSRVGRGYSLHALRPTIRALRSSPETKVASK